MAGGTGMAVKGSGNPPWVLEVSLTNETQQPITLYEHSLPWVGYYSTLLVAAKLDAMGAIVEQNLAVDDPGPGTVTLGPGETRTGEISLERHFPLFEEELAERDVIVFWSYQTMPVNGSPLPRAAGHVIFTKT